jgi:hypothetical protein
LRLKDPEQYKKKMVVLDKVKLSLDERIGGVNAKIAQIKDLEARLK